MNDLLSTMVPIEPVFSYHLMVSSTYKWEKQLVKQYVQMGKDPGTGIQSE